MPVEVKACFEAWVEVYGYNETRSVRSAEEGGFDGIVSGGSHQQNRRASTQVPSHTFDRTLVKCEIYLIFSFPFGILCGTAF